MDFDLKAQFEYALDYIKTHAPETLATLVGLMVLCWIYVLWSNRKSASDARLRKLATDPKSTQRTPTLQKRTKSSGGMPRFFQEHKLESSMDEPFISPLVLVVDDSKTALIAAAQALEGAPYRIITAIDGRVAWEKMVEERPSLVITDLEMPGVNGIELLRRMRGDLRFLDVPVVLVTAHPFDSIKQGREHGVSGFLAKPYHPTELREQVAFFLRNAY